MMSVSLDGYIEGPNREIDWHLVDDELHHHFNQQLKGMGAFLSGRVTYELMAAFWPTADTDPTSPKPIIEFARIWRDMPKIVYSKTLQRAGWKTTIVRDVVPEEVAQLKAQPGGDLALGGADLARAFMEHDLIDEYLIYVHPIVHWRRQAPVPTVGTQGQSAPPGDPCLRERRTTIALSQSVTS